MSDKSKENSELEQLLNQVTTLFKQGEHEKCSALEVPVKLALAKAKLLYPIPGNSNPERFILARTLLENLALNSIYNYNESSFSHCFSEIGPFYTPEGISACGGKISSNQNKIIGLHLLLLLATNDIAGFHTTLETIEEETYNDKEFDKFIEYPVKLERWLMEGSYDRVWKATQKGEVPSEEYAAFANVLVEAIRNEVASCSEKAYHSIPILTAKNLFFLPSDKSVIDFVSSKGWKIQNQRIYFPKEEYLESDAPVSTVIENIIGYARELETIV